MMMVEIVQFLILEDGGMFVVMYFMITILINTLILVGTFDRKIILRWRRKWN